MIKGISYWSMKDGLANTHPVDDALNETKKAGFDALELCIGPEGAVHVGLTEDECGAIRKQVDAAGVVVQTLASGMSWGFNPVSNDAAVREKAIELHEAALQRAAWLGCDAMLFVPGTVNSPISPDEHVRYDEAMERAKVAVGRLLKTAERVGVDLCVENVWNGFMYSPLEFKDFVDSFGHERLGVYFDCGNLMGYQQWPPHWIELLGERIKRVHVKGFKEAFGFEGTYAFCDLGAGDVPWKETAAALKAIGYDKTVIAEMMPWREDLLAVTSKAMNTIFG